jgi:hypothetical protein
MPTNVNHHQTADVRLLAQQAMQEMAQAQENDLRACVDEINSNASKKAEIRELQRLLSNYEEAVNEYATTEPPTAAQEEAMVDALGELRTAILDAGYGNGSDLYLETISPDATGGIGTGTFQGIIDNRDSYFGNLEALLDGESEKLSDLGDGLQVQMQLSISALGVADKTASDILKAFSDSVSQIAANIKP